MAQAQQNNIPKIRFPEFEGEWKEKKMRDLCTLKGRIGYRGYTINDIVEKGEGALALSPSNITSCGKLRFERNTYISWFKYDESPEIMVENGHILLVKTGSTYGKNALVKNLTEKATLNPQMVLVKPLHDYNQKFISLFMSYTRFQKQIYRTVVGGAIPTLSQENILNFKVLIPLKKEQEKIADFLGSVDSKINHLNRKKDLLKRYKKGAMQQIFSQKIRFKDDDGKGYPDWEEKKLGEIGNSYGGLTGKTKEDFGEGSLYIQYKQIFRSSKINIKECAFVKLSANERQNKALYGDVFFTTSSEIPKEIATASVLLDQVQNVYLNSFCFGYRPNLNILNPHFLRFAFRESNFRKNVIPLAQGSTRFNISKSAFLKLEFKFPNMKEQEKIANFLSAIDKKIEFVSTQIEQTEQFKKALLQQMFV